MFLPVLFSRSSILSSLSSSTRLLSLLPARIAGAAAANDTAGVHFTFLTYSLLLICVKAVLIDRLWHTSAHQFSSVHRLAHRLSLSLSLSQHWHIDLLLPSTYIVINRLEEALRRSTNRAPSFFFSFLLSSLHLPKVPLNWGIRKRTAKEEEEEKKVKGEGKYNQKRKEISWTTRFVWPGLKAAAAAAACSYMFLKLNWWLQLLLWCLFNVFSSCCLPRRCFQQQPSQCKAFTHSFTST